MSADEHWAPNVLRRATGAAICFSPTMLLVASLCFSPDKNRHAWSGYGVGFILAAVPFAALNFYLSFIRPHVFRLLHGSMDGFRRVSGIPIVGSILVLLGALFGFGALGLGTALLGLASVGFDTGGSVWFLIYTWRDSSLWDR